MRIAAIVLTFFMSLFVLSPGFAQMGSSDPVRWANQPWTTDFSQSIIDYSEVVDVLLRDQIPSIDDPQFQPAHDETRIPGNEPVVAFELGDTARAYPLRYLMWHEIVNDVVADVPVAITYCPLCNSSAVFERTLDGQVVTFGTTGKLRNSDLIMYDRTQENWWQQFNGEAIAGARAGERLIKLPSSLISFDQFLERFPDGEVLLPDKRRASRAGENPYVNYDSSRFPFLFQGQLPDDINPMERVALVQSNPPVAVALSFLNLNAPYRIGDLEFTFTSGQASALDRQQIADGKDVGSIEVFDVSGGERQLVAYEVAFAFAARAFYPDLEITQLSE